QSVSACWRGRHRKCARSRLQPVPGDDRRMATAPKPATSPWGRATDGLDANAADPAGFSAVRPVGRKNARRRNDRIWGDCSSVTCGAYYTTMRPRPTPAGSMPPYWRGGAAGLAPRSLGGRATRANCYPLPLIWFRTSETLFRLHLVACSQTRPQGFPLRLITRNLSSDM